MNISGWIPIQRSASLIRKSRSTYEWLLGKLSHQSHHILIDIDLYFLDCKVVAMLSSKGYGHMDKTGEVNGCF